jgi:hypothetical protein
MRTRRRPDRGMQSGRNDLLDCSERRRRWVRHRPRKRLTPPLNVHELWSTACPSGRIRPGSCGYIQTLADQARTTASECRTMACRRSPHGRSAGCHWDR